MSRFVQTIRYTASGTIAPASIAKIDPSNDLKVLQAGVGDKLLGIVTDGSDALPVSTLTAVAATSGETLYIYAPGSYALLTAGVGGWARGDLLTADASGYGVTAKPGDYVVAQADATASANDVREVIVLPPGQVMGVGGGTFTVVTANTTLTAASSNTAVFVNGTDLVMTLPAVATAKGFRARFINYATTATYTGGSVGTLITIPSADGTAGVQMKGHDITTPANGKGIVNTAATAKQGDTMEVYCDGATWWELPNTGTWTRQS